MGIAEDPPMSLMEHSMMCGAQHHEIVRVGRAAVGPVHDVVRVQEVGPAATREAF